MRIFFGVGGPNFTSSFHVIGEIFDSVYTFGSITSPPLTDVQTVTVPPGGATIVDFKIDRGRHYVLVDHALSRAERGLAGYLIVDGPEDDDIMHSRHRRPGAAELAAADADPGGPRPHRSGRARHRAPGPPSAARGSFPPPPAGAGRHPVPGRSSPTSGIRPMPGLGSARPFGGSLP